MGRWVEEDQAWTPLRQLGPGIEPKVCGSVVIAQLRGDFSRARSPLLALARHGEMIRGFKWPRPHQDTLIGGVVTSAGCRDCFISQNIGDYVKLSSRRTKSAEEGLR